MKKFLRPRYGALSVGAVMTFTYVIDITRKHRRRKNNPGPFSNRPWTP